MNDLAIFDLDGCLSDDRWRRCLIAHSRGDRAWDAYHAGIYNDDPNPEALELLREAIDGRMAIAIVTARPQTYDETTAEWLRQHAGLPPSDYVLWSRREGDTRTSPDFKRDAMTSLISSPTQQVGLAVDDRADVLEAYKAAGVHPDRLRRVDVGEPVMARSEVTAAEILAEAAETFGERQKTYGSNYTRVAPVVRALFPDGLPPGLVENTVHWHLFELILVKLSRFAVSELTHVDSIHDAAVYAAMIEAELRNV